MAGLEIDHVVLAARSRADAERVLGQAGLAAARGRVIPGLGLSNLVVPLRLDQSLEIHYPNGETASPARHPCCGSTRRRLRPIPLIC